MKAREVILRAIDGGLNWYQDAEILGSSDRQIRSWCPRYERWVKVEDEAGGPLTSPGAPASTA